jgi:adenosine deaminase
VLTSHRRILFAGLLFMPLALGAQSQPPPAQRAARELDAARADPQRLLAFLQAMPKGADLHNHLGGAVYAESLLGYAAANGQCVERATAQVVAGPCEPCEASAKRPAASCATADKDPALRDFVIDAWSMRNWRPGRESGHDHYFATFDKFGPATAGHTGEMLAEAAGRAAADHLLYVELMTTPDGMQAAGLGAAAGWNDDFAALRQQLLPGLTAVVATTRKKLDDDEAKMRATLNCGSPQPDPGCGVTVRYLYQVLRGLPRERVFAQILFGYELATADPRVVGVNLVMPEDAAVPMGDFRLHMRMLEFMHGAYPAVHLTLHAGELTGSLVPPDGLRFHIRESVERAHAERIGHGVSVRSETGASGLLHEMAARHVLVEINLTSNDLILGVAGRDHPLAAYLKAGVPVALSTDDEGVSRSDMTHEYLRAVRDQHVTYADLMRMARLSLEHSFLPGASLWRKTSPFAMTRACADDRVDAATPSARCAALLQTSEKARLEWEFERRTAAFEQGR